MLLVAFVVQVARGAGVAPPLPRRPGQNAGQSGDSHRSSKGQKLVLKDGSVQIVREYRVEGDRIRYYSLERSQWEEIPKSLIDWDATKKAAAAATAEDAKLNKEVHYQEEGRLAQPLDIDASLEVAPGIFLPSGEGLFVFDGKKVLPMSPAETDSKVSKRRAIEKVLVPIPVIPSRHEVTVKGAHAKLRVRRGMTEFYMRTADAREPDMNLVRVKIHGDSRTIANVDALFGEQAASADSLLIQRWEIAKGVYRFTMGQTLEPGEYALIEIFRDSSMQENGIDIYVWDFGVDPGAVTSKPTTQ